MSSPMTVGVTVDPFSVLLAASLIRAGESVAEAYADARTQHTEHLAARQTNASQRAVAAAQGTAALTAAARDAESKLDRLTRLAESLGVGARITAVHPQAPATDTADALAQYIRQLEALNSSLESVLLTEAGQRADEAHAPLLDDVLAEFSTLPSSTHEQPSTHLLARIHHLGNIPPEIAALAQELDNGPSSERAELLATELRLRIQQILRSEQLRAVDEATATVLEHSLKDLGYQVEEVAHTLYVEGGAVHFRRPDWGDYMVRMRLDFKHKAVNFNVIRTVNEGDNARSVMDHLAEDRWCTEFPALMRALEARGILFQVTRRVEPGDLPVQLVDRSRVPQFSDEHEPELTRAPRAREI